MRALALASGQDGAEEISGQERAAEILLRAWSGDSISHAYLFKGPNGVGKKRMAQAFAALLNCQNRPPAASGGGFACGSCPSCKKLAAGSHPDFIEIIPDGVMVKIDQIRELKRNLAYPPLEAKTRVVFIADIHAVMSRPEVANSLLKTLEEPPADTIFILTVDEAADILPTILSRCQVVPFYSLPCELITQRLLEMGVEAADARTMAQVSEGSLLRAKALAADDLLTLRRRVVEELSRLQAGEAAGIMIVLELAAICAKLASPLDFLDILQLWLRDLMVLGAAGPESAVLNRDLAGVYAESWQRWSLPELSERMRLIAKAKKELASNCKKTSVFEVLFFGFLN